MTTDTLPLALTSNQVRLADALGQPRIAGLDFLRAVAVLLVLTSHSGLYRIGPLAIFDGGFGVEMFFVISGFLITGILLKEVDVTGDIRLGAFYRRRAARLLPVFYAYLLAGLFLLLIRDKPAPWGAIASSAVYVINYYQAFTGAQPDYLSHCWSLAVEEQFYLLWPLLLLFVVRRRMSLAKTLIAVLFGVWFIRAAFIFVFDVSDAYIYRALETRADQLAIGCLLAVALRTAHWREIFERWAQRPWLWIALICAIVGSLSLFRGSMFFKYVLGYALEPVLAATLIPLVIVAANGEGWGARLLNAAPLVLIGEISYGMYLFHPYVMHATRNTLERLSVPIPIAVAASILAVIVIAYASFRYFEKPLRQRLRGK